MRLDEAHEMLAEARALAAKAKQTHHISGGCNVVTSQDISLADAVARLADVVEKLCNLNLSLVQRR